MNFDVKRKGYSKEQVDEYLKRQDETLASKEERIAALSSEVESLKEELGKLEGKRELIVKAIYSAIAKAEQIEQLSKAKYDAEMARLKAFHEKWVSYYNKLLARYPMDDEMIGVSKFNAEMTEALTPEAQLASEKKRLGGIGSVKVKYKEKFDPVKSIEEYLSGDEAASVRNTKAYKTGVAAVNPALAGKSESGFSFEEALNPTEDLSDIMKDLGILEK